MTPIEWVNSQYLFDIIETTLTLTGSVAQACNANPNRVCLMVGQIASSGVFLSTKSTMTNLTAMSITPSTAPFTITAATHGRLVTVPWFVTTPSGSGTIIVFEVLFKDR